MTPGQPGDSIQRVRKAYEQVADQLRGLIMEGSLVPGERLPNEQVLAKEFGVSRATVREALRVLSTENLIRTMKGGLAGGTYVSTPSVDHVSEFLEANIRLLSMSHDVTLDEFLEARECLEIPATRLATERIDEAGIELLRQSIPEDAHALTTGSQFDLNKNFHSALVDLAGNKLLTIASQPVFEVLRTHLVRSTLGQRVHDQINEDHRDIAEAMAAGDAERAAEEMQEHLKFLRPHYERAWRYAQHRETS